MKKVLQNVSIGFVLLGLLVSTMAHADNVNASNKPLRNHFKKGAYCVQETSKSAMFTCWGIFDSQLVSVEDIYNRGWRVVAFKPRTDNPEIIDNGMLIIEEQ